jgi:hypothetical protein
MPRMRGAAMPSTGSRGTAAPRVDTIVNTVNTVGVMGKGIALQFKRKWPANGWNARKREIMKTAHIWAAYDRLVAKKWLEAA